MGGDYLPAGMAKLLMNCFQMCTFPETYCSQYASLGVDCCVSTKIPDKLYRCGTLVFLGSDLSIDAPLCAKTSKLHFQQKLMNPVVQFSDSLVNS